ncbi:MAG TPA: 2-dehydropantoate 2-reductase N-terminal domain-containing protein [Bacteroidales bacterium]|nr:2-dehydropantoate 2-reductase N-terminal domain-containing protein [Bacteroidales bacterium]HPT01070.1 2-dehydropantoate 2-reductase N-terminal domain-containing protein [Bacteroidales bacterium]
MNNQKKITIIGAGSIGTALGNVLSLRPDLNVNLLSVESDVVSDISTLHINQKYFPNIRLNPSLKATTAPGVLRDSEIIFIGIPSTAVIPYLQEIRDELPENAILVNLAKGFGIHKKVIALCLRDHFPNPTCALKGPSFAREIINNVPTALTLASTSRDTIQAVAPLFDGTTVYIDTTTDVAGVEVLSILKNIYAIIIGIVDAHFHSPNLRFFIFTKAFNEMRNILLHVGGREETMFNYCGIGDFGLTALNDMSRNHTLGLLIGKGFFTEDISGKVVLEGRIATEIFLEELEKSGLPPEKYPLMRELQQTFQGNHNVSDFVNKIIS